MFFIFYSIDRVIWRKLVIVVNEFYIKMMVVIIGDVIIVDIMEK